MSKFGPEAVERVAECIAAVRELADCKHEIVVTLGRDAKWCAHCGALFMDDEWRPSRIGRWATTVDFEKLLP